MNGVDGFRLVTDTIPGMLHLHLSQSGAGWLGRSAIISLPLSA